MSTTVYVIAGGPKALGDRQPVGVFTNVEDARRYTGATREEELSNGSQQWSGRPGAVYNVWKNVPLNPPIPTGGRKKTARRRRRTTRKH